jgi:hypothetical protein
MQHSSHILMIKPVQFDFNSQTAVNNSFQVSSPDGEKQSRALAEFNRFIDVLEKQGIDVTVVEDTVEPHTPDSVFPNNWISFHADGRIVLYPMFAENRRLERKQHVLDAIRQKFLIRQTLDLTHFEKEHLFLEGTGSMVLDRDHQIAYACLSPRTMEKPLADFCARLGYRAISFTAVDEKGDPIYHTNVMMCVADSYAILCLDCIPNEAEKKALTDSLRSNNKEIIPISYEQVNHFAGNMLQVHNRRGEKWLVMSSQAYRSLSANQLALIEKYNPILHSDITTIETNGGGSARCMMAEIFLPEK